MNYIPGPAAPTGPIKGYSFSRTTSEPDLPAHADCGFWQNGKMPYVDTHSTVESQPFDTPVTPEKCKDACDTKSDCNAWLMYGQGNDASCTFEKEVPNQCYNYSQSDPKDMIMYSSPNLIHQATYCGSWKPPPPPPPPLEFLKNGQLPYFNTKGTLLGTRTNTTANECRKDCQGNPDCSLWLIDPKDDPNLCNINTTTTALGNDISPFGDCTLWNDTDPKSTTIGYIRPGETDDKQHNYCGYWKDEATMPYVNLDSEKPTKPFNDTAVTPEKCRDACDTNSDCDTWLMDPQGKKDACNFGKEVPTQCYNFTGSFINDTTMYKSLDAGHGFCGSNIPSITTIEPGSGGSWPTSGVIYPGETYIINGTISVTEPITNNGTIENNGTINIGNSAGDKQTALINNGKLTNTKTIVINGGGTITNNASGTLTQLLPLGSLQINKDGALINSGALINRTLLSIESGAVLTNYGKLTNYDNILNSGTIINNLEIKNDINAIIQNYLYIINDGIILNQGNIKCMGGTIWSSNNKGQVVNENTGVCNCSSCQPSPPPPPPLDPCRYDIYGVCMGNFPYCMWDPLNGKCFPTGA